MTCAHTNGSSTGSFVRVDAARFLGTQACGRMSECRFWQDGAGCSQMRAVHFGVWYRMQSGARNMFGGTVQYVWRDDTGRCPQIGKDDQMQEFTWEERNQEVHKWLSRKVEVICRGTQCKSTGQTRQQVGPTMISDGPTVVRDVRVRDSTQVVITGCYDCGSTSNLGPTGTNVWAVLDLELPI